MSEYKGPWLAFGDYFYIINPRVNPINWYACIYIQSFHGEHTVEGRIINAQDTCNEKISGRA